jgi:hypothetical protein
MIKTLVKVSVSLLSNLDAYKNQNATTIQDRGHPMLNRRHHGNVSLEVYDRANKIEDKSRKNQEQRLANILKMHDNNMKRGVGIANKNRAL